MDAQQAAPPLEMPVANLLATGAPGTIQLGGETYLVAQPTEADMATIGMEARKLAKRRRDHKLMELYREFKDMAVVKDLLGSLLPPENDDAANLQDAIMDPDGCRFAAFILLRRLQPDMTLAQLGTLIDESNATAVGMALLIESGLGKAAKNSPGGAGSSS